ncbi:MAG: division/cell wall cluster transcriptional repressor MraZ [Oscillochloridaceae bacterium]|nr:division/cell wall cluster transcriptional repressor MraZ [Chloroflexaceae bacterium]MDW8392092.1 division/cell wall cluster transcriptional repressor MraZ [Oscillochloridaceae bacterium]
MFIGTFESVVEPSGRIALPLAFRAAAIEGLIVTRGFERCAQAFPIPIWQELARRVNALPLFVDGARQARSLLFATAAEVTLDATGMVLLPRLLLAYAGITSTVVLVGMGAFFELWAPESWHAASDRLLDAASRWAGGDLPPILADI